MSELAEEFEACEAIYAQDFKVLEPLKACEITVRGDPAEEANNHVECAVRLALGKAKYPDQPPEVIEVVSKKGLNEQQCGELSALLRAEMAKQAGSPMIFAAVEFAKEWVVERNIPGSGGEDMHSKMMVREFEKKKEQEKLQRLAQSASGTTSLSSATTSDSENASSAKKKMSVFRTEGTPVTVESFNAWLTQYKKETAVQNAQGAEMSGKLTGRQVFERGLSGTEGEGGAAAEEGEEEEEEEEDDEEGALDAFREEEEVELSSLDSD